MDYAKIGKKIYDTKKPREMRRYLVFRIRCLLERGMMAALFRYFHSSETLQKLSDVYPFVYEQPTRAFFYHRSTARERARLVMDHFGFLVEKLREDVLTDIYLEKNIPLWEGAELDGERLAIMLYFEAGQRKEGLLSVMMRLGDHPLYQIIFWIARDEAGGMAMYIGAMQGPNMDDAKEIVKRVTKLCHAYRTKNLILYAARAVARALGLTEIYAVTNEGYYANNHVRTDRKLMTDFSKFWAEAGGAPTEDVRFFALPLTEERKTMEEVPTRKRAVYKKRFTMLDEVDASISRRMGEIMTH